MENFSNVTRLEKLSRTFFGQKKKQVESWSLFAKAAKSESTSSTSTVRRQAKMGKRTLKTQKNSGFSLIALLPSEML